MAWANAQEVQQECGVSLTKITPHAPVDSMIIAVSHKQFAQMVLSELKKLCALLGTPVIVELKALYDRKALEAQAFEVFRF
jgi:hypothetical protein